MNKSYYNLEGYPCSKEEYLNEVKVFKAFKDSVSTKVFKKCNLPIIYGTGGETFSSIKDWEDL